MMDSGMKQKILDEIMEHIGSSQGNDLKSLLDQSKMPDPSMKDGMGSDMGSMGKPDDMDGKANPLSGKPGMPGMDDKMGDISDELTQPDDMKDDDSELSDEELEELLKKLT